MPDWTDSAAEECTRGRAWAQRRRYIQSLRRLCTPSLTLPRLRGREGRGRGLPVARRQTRRRLRVLRGRYQGRGTAPVLLKRRQSGDRALPHRHVHRQHRATPRHGWRTAGQGWSRDGTGGLHHAKQRRLDHVRQTPELTAMTQQITGSRRSLSDPDPKVCSVALCRPPRRGDRIFARPHHRQRSSDQRPH